MSNVQKGFTLVELLITISILATILALGLFIGFDFYKSYALGSEKTTALSMLQKARGQAMDNINQKRHGVRFFLDPAHQNALTYILFECQDPCVSYPGSAAGDLVIGANSKASIASPALPFDIVFEQLDGNCVSANCASAPLSITLNDQGKTSNISIDSEGAISY